VCAERQQSKNSASLLDFKTLDKEALDVLSVWYSHLRGTWTSTGWWNSANILTTLIDFSVYTNDSTTYIDTIHNTFLKNVVFDLEGIDDEGWWGLAWVRAHALTGETQYLTLAKAIFKDMSNYWDNQCNGGVWWNRARTYKNAVTNELFFALAASLYIHTNDDTYKTWAMKEWQWLESSGLINSNYLVNDGLTSQCSNNGQTTWTYNQGVILGGLADLWKITNNDTLLKTATSIATATFKNLVYADGILRETCEPQKSCNGDQSQFKGIFMRHLGYLYTVTKDTQIGGFILSNANSIWNRDRNVTADKNYLGLYWEGPYDKADPSRQSSACDCLNAALLIN
jgi:predicted alpha-1,6-mannanase (GH76 family)